MRHGKYGRRRSAPRLFISAIIHSLWYGRAAAKNFTRACQGIARPCASGVKKATYSVAFGGHHQVSGPAIVAPNRHGTSALRWRLADLRRFAGEQVPVE